MMVSSDPLQNALKQTILLDLIVNKLTSLQGDYVERYDWSSTSNTLYMGWAKPGSNEGEKVWKIKRLVFDAAPTSGNPLSSAYPKGSALFEFAWGDRTSLSYK